MRRKISKIDYVAELRRILPLIEKTEYVFDMENYAPTMWKDITMEEWGMSKRDFEDFVEWMDKNNLIFLEDPEEEIENEYGVIVDIRPDMYMVNNRAVKKYLKKYDRRASWDDPRYRDSGEYDDPREEYPTSREDEFYDYLHGS